MAHNPETEGNEMAGAAGRPRRSLLPLLFLAVNIVGLAVIIWQIHSLSRPSGALAVVRTLPAGKISPGKTAEISVEFNAALEPRTVKEDSLTLVPAVSGKTVLEGPRTLTLHLAKPLQEATRYRIAVSRDVRGMNGERPAEGLLFLNTQPLQVCEVSQAGIEADRSAILAIRFNQPVNPLELARRLKLTGPDNSPILFEAAGTKPDSVVRVRVPAPQWGRLHLLIGEGLTGTEGPLPLEGPFQADVSVTAKLRLVRVSGECRYDRGAVEIVANSPISAATADAFVTIEPPVPHTFDASDAGLTIVGDFRSARRYLVTLKAGLPAGAAGKLEENVTRTVWFPDRPERVFFAFGGGYLSPQGLLKVPLRSVNVKRSKLYVQRLYPSNIVEFVLRNQGERFGALAAEVQGTEIRFEEKRNEEVEALLDLRQLVGNDDRGVYGLFVQSPQESWWSDEAAVVVTDLGLSLRLEGRRALVWVTSIAGATPVEGVEVTLYSKSRQKLGTALTGADGLALIPVPDPSQYPKAAVSEPPETEVRLMQKRRMRTGLAEDDEPALLLASKGNDMSYLHLSRNARSRGPGAAGGSEYLARGYEAFVFAERGAYRPGDVAKLSGFVRGAGWKTPDPIPLELAVNKPNGRELLKKGVMSDATGRLLAEAALPTDAPSGLYRVYIRLPGKSDSLGETNFLVADYTPRTLRMKLDAPADPLPASQPFDVKAHVEHLFSDSARGLAVRCRAAYRAEPFHPQEWLKYTFGDARQNPGKSRADLPQATLDPNGNAVFTLQPPKISTSAAIRAAVEVEVVEPGGRALVETLTRRLDPWEFYLGVQSPEQSLTQSKPWQFAVVAVDPLGKPSGSPKGFRACFYRVTYSNVLRREGRERLEYEWTRHEKLIAVTQGTLAAGQGGTRLSFGFPGEYRLVVESAGGCPVTCDFQVSGPGAGWAMSDPEQILLTLDRKSYRPGETARLSIRAPFGGTALVCVESDRVLQSHVVPMAGGEGSFEFTADEAWRPNVYVTATLIRPVEAEEEWRPHRASGVVRLDVDCADRKLDVAVQSPGDARPEREIAIAVHVNSGGAPKAGAAVVLAAVDEGILALTGYTVPAPWDFFYAPRRLAVREFDMYSNLAPELAAWRVGKKAEPGGGEAAEERELSRRISPVQAQRVKSVVLYAGTLTTDAQGIARAHFTVPEYVGELRVMAAAASGDSFGAAGKALPVKSPIMTRASWPRFLAPGDEFELPVTVFNRTSAGGDVALALELKGPIEAGDAAKGGAPNAERGTGTLQPQRMEKVNVPAGQERTVRLRLRATAVGKAEARWVAKLGEESYAETVEIPVRPPVAFARMAGTTVIEGGSPARLTIGGHFLPGTEKCSLVIGGTPLVELTGALHYLLDYPYGCVEQTVSRMVPLIYLRDLVELSTPGAVGPMEIDELLRAGFLRLQMMQVYDNGLGMWPGAANPYPWGSLYAADLLVEARKAGGEVPEDLLDSLLRYTSANLDGWITAKDVNGNPTMFTESAYACSILARAGRPAQPQMAQLEEIVHTCDAAKTALSATGRFYLSAAYLASGERKAAKEFIGDAQPACAARQADGCLESPVREAAVMLRVLLDLDPESSQIPALAERLKRNLHLGAWGTTQENAFALMALGKYARALGPVTDCNATVTMPDGSSRAFTLKQGFQTSEIRSGQSLTARVDGKSKLYAFWHAEGVPADGTVKEEDSGLAIRRDILEVDGRAAGPAALTQGRIYHVRLTLSADRAVGNLVINDLLPAGLELEDPNLRGAARIGAEGEEPARLVPERLERRDDRLIAFVSFGGGKAEFRYAVRAVTAGTFVLPAVEASCMYDPGLYSLHGRGKVTIK